MLAVALPHLRRRARNGVGEVAPVRARLDRLGLDSREVEEIVDETAETIGFLLHGGQELVFVARVEPAG